MYSVRIGKQAKAIQSFKIEKCQAKKCNAARNTKDKTSRMKTLKKYKRATKHAKRE